MAARRCIEMRESVTFALALLLMIPMGCQDPTEEAEPDFVSRELVTIDAPDPPVNPETGTATPEHLNKIRFLRYRATDETLEVRAIVICVPGMPAGATAYDELARRLVRLSEGRVEVWAIDRRSNLLEDLTGMEAAERESDPDLAWRYYSDGDEVDGRIYEGLPEDLEYMSEWGLATAVADLRTVLDLVPQEARRSQVILVGHSFGASQAQAFASWDHEGSPNADELAGLILMDGGFNLQMQVDEERYLTRGYGGSPGLEELRQGVDPYLDYVGFGIGGFMLAEITAMRAWLHPHEPVEDDMADLVGSILFLQPMPPMTASAMVGFLMDDASSPDPGMRASCGAPTGPVEAFEHPMMHEVRYRPSNLDELYDWIDCDDVDPPEKTSVRVLARVTHEGPTNRNEWFFPSRLILDTAAVRNLEFDESSWQWEQGLRATRTAEVDLPVLAIAAGQGLVPLPTLYHRYRDRLAPQVGEDRPRGGAGRESTDLDESGFAIWLLDDYAHDDVVHASHLNADEELYIPLLGWILDNTEGSMQIGDIE